MKTLTNILIILALTLNGYSQRTIEADLSQTVGPRSMVWQHCVGAGRANEGLRADWRTSMNTAHAELGFRYIRFHGLFHDDMGVYREDKDGNPVYNFQYVDNLYDYLLSIGMKPFVELSFMPSALKSTEKTVFWWEANISAPNDYAKWEDFITAFVRHLTNRYGADEVKAWYFEVWNEPDLPFFFDSTQAEYFKLYGITAKAIKDVNPAYRVGGPATSQNKWLEEFIAHCHENALPLDYISTHSYGVRGGFVGDDPTRGLLMVQDERMIWSDVQAARELIEKSPYAGMELHYTEWNSSYSPLDPVHDTYQNASYILDKIKNTEDHASSMSYWTFTDIFEEAGPPPTPFHGGFGLLNMQNIKKPSFFAYKYLAMLGDTELKNEDPASWVTKKADGSLQVLFWDFTIEEQSSVNQKYYKADQPPKDSGMVELRISGLAPGRYMAELFRTGYGHNDAYTEYLRMGSPNPLSPRQVHWLKEHNNGGPVKHQVIEIGEDGNFSESYMLRTNDLFFIKLEPIE